MTLMVLVAMTTIQCKSLFQSAQSTAKWSVTDTAQTNKDIEQ
jgi:hypothetical protein